MPDPIGDVSIPLFPGADKIVHSVMFGGQTLTLCIDIFRKGLFKPLSLWHISAIITLTSMFGSAIEYLQSTMQIGRGFELADILADTTGCIIFAMLWKIYLEKRLIQNG